MNHCLQFCVGVAATEHLICLAPHQFSACVYSLSLWKLEEFWFSFFFVVIFACLSLTQFVTSMCQKADGNFTKAAKIKCLFIK